MAVFEAHRVAAQYFAIGARIEFGGLYQRLGLCRSVWFEFDQVKPHLRSGDIAVIKARHEFDNSLALACAWVHNGYASSDVRILVDARIEVVEFHYVCE
jgi:hypothetical protein